MQNSINVTIQIDDALMINRLQEWKRMGIKVLVVLKNQSYGLGPPHIFMKKFADYCIGFYFADAVEALENANILQSKCPEWYSKGNWTIMTLYSPWCNIASQELHDLRIRPIMGWDGLMLLPSFSQCNPLIHIDMDIGRNGIPLELFRRPELYPNELKLLDDAARNVNEIMWSAKDSDDVKLLQDLLDSSHPTIQKLSKRWQVRHASASGLFEKALSQTPSDKTLLLDAVRIGLSLFKDAVKVSTKVSFVPPLPSSSPYTVGFRRQQVSHHFTLPIGYAHAHCIRNGQPLIIETCQGLIPAQVIEIGMSTSVATASILPNVGDTVWLLHPNGPTLEQVAKSWNTTQQHVLYMLGSAANDREFISFQT